MKRSIDDYKNQLKGQISLQIAKQLYIVFDCKPLEKSVFIAADKSLTGQRISVYTSAAGSKRSNYMVVNGVANRQRQKDAARGYNDQVQFRKEPGITAEEKLAEVALLGDLSFHHILIAFLTFEEFGEVEDFEKSIIDNFIKLVAVDHSVAEKSLFSYYVKSSEGLELGTKSDTSSIVMGAGVIIKQELSEEV